MVKKNGLSIININTEKNAADQIAKKKKKIVKPLTVIPQVNCFAERAAVIC